MKKPGSILLLLYISITNPSFAQEINWRSIDQGGKHIVSAYFGADYSSYYGFSYGYVVKNKITPIITGAELTVPFGDDVFDDWRMKVSAQAELWNKDRLSLGIRSSFILRRYESALSRLYNVGADALTQFGYTKEKWALVAIFHYDRAIATHIQHDLLKEYYPEITDGWYGATGGNFKFGLRGNISIRSLNTFLSVGKIYGQDFKHNPTLPFYAELSIQKMF